MSPIPEPSDRQIITDLEALKVYFDPMRKRIMQELVPRACSVNELADLLDVPFTRLYYHIGLLEKHGFVHLVETRQGAGAIEEKYYRATSYQYIIAHDLMRPGTSEAPGGLELVLAAVLDATKADIISSVQHGDIALDATAPDPSALMIRRGVVRLTPEQAARFYERLIALLMDISAEQQSDGRSYGIAVTLYPSAFTDATES